MKREVSYKLVALTFGVLVACFAIAFYAVGFTEPTLAPPGGNVDPPLNVGNVGQSKEGGLLLNIGNESGSAEYGLIIQNGKVGISTSSPTEKLEVDGNIKASGNICDSNGCIGKSKIVYLSPSDMIEYNVDIIIYSNITKWVSATYSINLDSVKATLGETRNIKGLFAKLQMHSTDSDVIGGDVSLIVTPNDSEYSNFPYGDRHIYFSDSYRTYDDWINGQLRFSGDAYLVDPNGNGNIEIFTSLGVRPGFGNLTNDKILKIIIVGYITD